jgi:aryl carrier-like protein
MEERIAEVWREVLGLAQVGVHDNFFDLGGHSISSIRIVARLRDRGIALAPVDLFRTQTVSTLAALLEGRRVAAVTQAASVVSEAGGPFATVELEPEEMAGLLGDA